MVTRWVGAAAGAEQAGGSRQLCCSHSAQLQCAKALRDVWAPAACMNADLSQGHSLHGTWFLAALAVGVLTYTSVRHLLVPNTCV
jgi:hypothetical protein